MNYTTIKRFILWMPAVAVGVWEFLRHTLLLPYMTMEMGNMLTPVLVFLITITLSTRMFKFLEHTESQLRKEQAMKAVLEEREQLARELHDGISQSLFLLSVKLDRIERSDDPDTIRKQTLQLKGTVRHVYDDVRQSIAGLRSVPAAEEISWMQSLHELIHELQAGGIQTKLHWKLPESVLSAKEKVELLAIIREAVINIRKHSQAKYASIVCEPKEPNGFYCQIEDDGIGIQEEDQSGKFGLRIMKDRAISMGWGKINVCCPSGRAGTAIEIHHT